MVCLHMFRVSQSEFAIKRFPRWFVDLSFWLDAAFDRGGAKNRRVGVYERKANENYSLYSTQGDGNELEFHPLSLYACLLEIRNYFRDLLCTSRTTISL